MAYADRRALYDSIEKLRGRPLIVYVTSPREGSDGEIEDDLLPKFIAHLELLEDSVDELDLMVVSTGGDGNVIWRLVCLLRDRFTRWNILLPYEAYSAATMLALGADEIVMHLYSNLGHVDPQIIYPDKHGDDRSFAAEQIGYFFKMLESLGVTDQEHIASAFQSITEVVGPLALGYTHKSLQSGASIVDKVLELRGKKGKDRESIVDAFSRTFHDHAYPIDRQEAKQIGLDVIHPGPELASMMWEIWTDIRDEMDADTPFRPDIELIAANPDLLGPLTMIGTDEDDEAEEDDEPDIHAEDWMTNGEDDDEHPHIHAIDVTEQGEIKMVMAKHPVPFEHLAVVLESSRASMQKRTRGTILGHRDDDGDVLPNLINTAYGWTTTKATSS